MTVEPGDLIAAATLIVGFGVTVIMFRVQRELWVQEHHPGSPTWLAWSDYLILASVGLALFLVLVPLLFLRVITPLVQAVAAAACVAAVFLQAGYIPSILAHYRIEIGRGRKGDRLKGEPAERLLAVASAALAIGAFILVICWRFRLA
jgi:uncharacterized membrane protein